MPLRAPQRVLYLFQRTPKLDMGSFHFSCRVKQAKKLLGPILERENKINKKNKTSPPQHLPNKLLLGS